MAGKTDYKNKWQSENRERINLVVPKGYKNNVRKIADIAGESVNGYIKKAIDERMERDTNQQQADHTTDAPVEARKEELLKQIEHLQRAKPEPPKPQDTPIRETLDEKLARLKREHAGEK